MGKVLFVMKRQKRKDVWHFVRLIRKDECWEIARRDCLSTHADWAHCLLCNAVIKFRVGKSKVPEHVEENHPAELAVYQTQMQRRDAGENEPIIRNLANSFDRAADPGQKRPLRAITAGEQKRVNELLAEWIARHFRPMLIVEDAGFVEAIRFIAEDLGRVTLSIPKRAKIRSEIVLLAQAYRLRIRKEIKNGCLYYSITCDIWSSRNSKSYIAVTLHYVNQEFVPKNWTIDVREIPGIHDGDSIAAVIELILAEWMLLKRLCVMFVRNGGSNMVSAGNKLGLKHMSCIAHSLHLVVAGALIKKKKADTVEEPAWLADIAEEATDDITEHEEEVSLSSEDRDTIEGYRELAISEMEQYLDETIMGLQRNEMTALRTIVQHFRTLAVYFRKSPKGNNRLSALQREHFNVEKNKELKPVVDCPTRWNSCWRMLERFIALEAALVKFFGYLKNPDGRKEFKDMESKLRRPKPDEWLAIKCLKALLGPFAEVSEVLGGQSYPTAPLVLPALAVIRVHLERTDLFAALVAEAGDEESIDDIEFTMNECRKTMLVLFEERFRSVEKSDLKWVAFLDPRAAKRMLHLTPADTPAACDAVVREMVALANENGPGEGVYGRQTRVESTGVAEPSLHDRMFGPDSTPQRTTELDDECYKEFRCYLGAVANVKGGTSPYEWWRVNSSSYPNLGRVARKWLGMVATSVPSERAFSTCGNVLTVKRSSLSSAMMRDLVFVAENRAAGD